MEKPHWFPFFVNDFLASSKVALMSTEEIGAYILLLCHAWNDPTCSLPIASNSLSKLGRISGDLSKIRACFVERDGRLVNERLYVEWEKTNKIRAVRADLGRKGGLAKAKAIAIAKPKQTASISQSQSQSEKKKKETRSRMPENWTLSEAMKTYAKDKGMTLQTTVHEFEHCKTRHEFALFTNRGWEGQVWRTWCLNWVSFGAKQVGAIVAPMLPKAFLVVKTLPLVPHEPMPEDLRKRIGRLCGNELKDEAVGRISNAVVGRLGDRVAT
jgi:uncharacterized protein YdaU (DUF1376 family)